MKITIYFWVGSGSGRARCRLVLGETVEISSQDAMGKSAWFPAYVVINKHGGPDQDILSTEDITRVALSQVLDKTARVTNTDLAVEVELSGFV